jgi:hypothetical protein
LRTQDQARAYAAEVDRQAPLFSRVLDPGATVERVSYIIAGAGRCAYRVREA